MAIEANKLFKHLLITGATGSGKSNAVADIVDRLSSIGAPVIILHLRAQNADSSERRVYEGI